jgi:hypothetical protein
MIPTSIIVIRVTRELEANGSLIMVRNVLGVVLLVLSVLSLPARAQKTVSLPYTANDNSGNQWVLQQMGFLNMQGNQPIFGQAGMLTVNGQNVRWRENQLQQDDKSGELIFGEASAANLTVQRRVYFDADSGYARVVDVFANKTDREVSVNVQLQTHVNYGITTAGNISDPKGKNNPPIAWAGQTPVGRTALSVFAGKGAKFLPNVQYQQGNNMVQAQYALRVPPGKTLSIGHLHGTVGTQEEAAAYVKDMREALLFRYLPASVRKSLVNFPSGSSFIGDREVLRGDTFDVIELRSGDLLKGTVQQKSWSLTTFYGPVELPADRVSGVINVGQFRPRQLVVTDKGEMFGGQLSTDTLAITLTGGQEIKVPFSQISRVGYRMRPGEAEQTDDVAGQTVVILRSGDRMVVEPLTEPIEVFTRYGQLKLPPKSAVSVQFQSEDHGVHEVLLVDGSKFQGLVATPTFKLKLAGGASGQQIEVSQASLLALLMNRDDPGSNPEAAVCRLANGDQLVGRLDGTLKLETAFDTLELPGPQVRVVARRTEEGGDVQVTLWDGTSVSGQLTSPTLPLTLSAGTAVEVPVALLDRYQNPRPRPADAMVQRVREVVTRLSADDFKERESAEQELLKLGPAIIPVLRELRDAQGPEAQSRIDAVLKKLESVKSDAGFGPSRPVRGQPVPSPIIVDDGDEPDQIHVRFHLQQVEPQGVLICE